MELMWMWFFEIIIQLISMSIGYKIWGLAGLFLLYIFATILMILAFPYFFGLIPGV